MKKQDVKNLENWIKTLNEVNCALINGFGPAHNSNNIFVAIPGKIEYDAHFGDVYFAIVMEKSENGDKPIDWYSWSPRPNFVSGFGGWYKYGYDMLIKDNPWVKDILDSLDE